MTGRDGSFVPVVLLASPPAHRASAQSTDLRSRLHFAPWL